VNLKEPDMSKRILTPLFVVGLMPIALASTARAEGDCASDSDCPDGLVCEVTGGSSCAHPCRS
jgi:hypothetical protein